MSSKLPSTVSALTGVPSSMTEHLDDAAERLSAIAETEFLKFKAYEASEPDRKVWGHRLQGRARDREFYLAVTMHQADAPGTLMLVQAYMAHYLPSGQNFWFPLGWHLGHNAFTMVVGFRKLLDRARLACLLGMPHPTDPDLKA